jgi:phosphatidylserine/phosphatidylglycerophosphate/cardiolipin synthase-like enzyme
MVDTSAVATVAAPDAFWSGLVRFKKKPFPSDYPSNVRRFYSPQDDVHGAILALLQNTTSSLLISMYGEDDPELTDAVIKLAEDPDVFVQISLDKTQAAGLAEVNLVAKLRACPLTRVAIGLSRFHRINHLKMAVSDNEKVLTGSTNWSSDGEGKQNNEASIFRDRAIAGEATEILNAEHHEMLQQMGLLADPGAPLAAAGAAVTP